MKSKTMVCRNINGGNQTEWSAIRYEIIRVISKSNERAAGVRFEIKYDFRPKLHDTKFNYHFITPILKSYWVFFVNINKFLEKGKIAKFPPK